jgi:uncharacterized protein (DUF1501 family)
MQRRDFLRTGAALSVVMSGVLPRAFAQAAAARTLILIELKGGNDGLNTVVPYADPSYAQLRPRLALKDAELLKLDGHLALHAELKPLLPLWEARELAIVQGVGYAQPNLSHFRSIEIWETASDSNQYLDQGWLARAFAGPLKTQSAAWTADGVVVGGGGLGALAGARAVTLTDPEAFIRQSRLATPSPARAANATLEHLLRVEAEIQKAAEGLRGPKYAFKTEFPKGAFGNAVAAAMQVLATQQGARNVPVVHLQLGSFDTHQNQPAQQANLLRQFADGVAAMRSALQELNRWDSTLAMTYAEFGRRPRENQSNGTDHGTAAPHFAFGGAVRGGWYGQPPNLAALDASGNLPFAVDFRQLYATVLQSWWGVGRNASDAVLGAGFDRLPLLRA